MPAQWTSEIIGKMHLCRISQKALAAALGYTPEYVSTVLRGKREPKDAEARFRAAVDALAAQSHDTAEQDR